MLKICFKQFAKVKPINTPILSRNLHFLQSVRINEIYMNPNIELDNFFAKQMEPEERLTLMRFFKQNKPQDYEIYFQKYVLTKESIELKENSIKNFQFMPFDEIKQFFDIYILTFKPQEFEQFFIFFFELILNKKYKMKDLNQIFEIYESFVHFPFFLLSFKELLNKYNILHFEDFCEKNLENLSVIQLMQFLLIYRGHEAYRLDFIYKIYDHVFENPGFIDSRCYLELLNLISVEYSLQNNKERKNDSDLSRLVSILQKFNKMEYLISSPEPFNIFAYYNLCNIFEKEFLFSNFPNIEKILYEFFGQIFPFMSGEHMLEVASCIISQNCHFTDEMLDVIIEKAEDSVQLGNNPFLSVQFAIFLTKLAEIWKYFKK